MNCLSAYQSIYLSVYLSIYVRMSRLNRPLNLIDLATSASSKAIRHSSFSKLDGNKIAWFESPKSTTSPLSWSIKTISEEEEASIDWMAIDKLASANTKQVTSWIYKTAALDWKCAGNSHSLGTKPPTSNLMEVPWALSCISLFLSIRSTSFSRWIDIAWLVYVARWALIDKLASVSAKQEEERDTLYSNVSLVCPNCRLNNYLNLNVHAQTRTPAWASSRILCRASSGQQMESDFVSFNVDVVVVASILLLLAGYGTNTNIDNSIDNNWLRAHKKKDNNLLYTQIEGQ